MDKSRRTRIRTPGQRPPAHGDQPRYPDAPTGGVRQRPVASRWCPRCAAWVQAHFVHGALTEVFIQHRAWPCRARREALSVLDWRGEYSGPADGVTSS